MFSKKKKKNLIKNGRIECKDKKKKTKNWFEITILFTRVITLNRHDLFLNLNRTEIYILTVMIRLAKLFENSDGKTLFVVKTRARDDGWKTNRFEFINRRTDLN